tara:strand:+ start:1324 stop:1665 length:342 start_codon:yes stop_codon:yes gene_type:complete
MIKLRKILTELLNTYSVECSIWSEKKFPITDILNQIRALKKITIVGNITPEDYLQKENIDYTKLKIKFVTRGDAEIDVEKFIEDMTISDLGTKDLRIPGIRSVKFKIETLKRI